MYITLVSKTNKQRGKKMEQRKLKTGLKFREFDSVADVIAETERAHKKYAGSRVPVSKQNGDSRTRFTGAESYEEAAEKIKTYSPKNKKVNIDLSKIDRDANLEIAINRTVSGGSLDVGSFLAGEPECFVDMAPTVKSRAVILINGAYAHWASDNLLSNKASCIMSLIEALELKFDEVFCLVYFGADYRGKRFASFVNTGNIANDASEYYFFAEKSFFRRIMFGEFEAACENPYAPSITVASDLRREEIFEVFGDFDGIIHLKNTDYCRYEFDMRPEDFNDEKANKALSCIMEIIRA